MPGETPKSKRPTDSKFKQQKLSAWKPILTPRTVLPIFLVVGIAFIAVGIALLSASQDVKEQSWDYTECTQADGPDAGKKCSDLLGNSSSPYVNHTIGDRCRCVVPVNLTEGFDRDETFLYYALDNYYQNHRRYVKSRWDPQLRSTTTDGSSECEPLDKDASGKTIAPCGLVANSLFNDTIRLVKCSDSACTTSTNITLTGTDIAWKSDRDTKFRNPDVASPAQLCDADNFKDKATPPAWPVPACKLGTDSGVYSAHTPEFGSSGVGYENEDLIVWMRSAALPNFRKLYRKILNQNLEDGQYQLLIDYNYPVASFDGKKSVVISTTSWIGGKNPFLGICYLVVGSLCVLAGIIFVILQKWKGRELGADKYLTWDR